MKHIKSVVKNEKNNQKHKLLVRYFIEGYDKWVCCFDNYDISIMPIPELGHKVVMSSVQEHIEKHMKPFKLLDYDYYIVKEIVHFFPKEIAKDSYMIDITVAGYYWEEQDEF